MSSGKTQKALLLPARAAKFTLGEVPVPAPGPGDVLVKIVSAALNPIDWKIVDSDLFSPIISSYPYIPGTDGAGIVEEVGSEVTTLAKGDKMYVQIAPFFTSLPHQAMGSGRGRLFRSKVAVYS